MIDHKQCKACYYRLHLPAAELQIGCDYLGMTGVSRIANPPLTTEDGTCRYFVQDETVESYFKEEKQVEKINDYRRKVKKRFRNPANKTGPEASYIAQIGPDNRIIAIFKGGAEAARKTGVAKVSVYAACNWRTSKRKDLKGFGKKGFTFRHLDDPDIAEARREYEETNRLPL